LLFTFNIRLNQFIFVFQVQCLKMIRFYRFNHHYLSWWNMMKSDILSTIDNIFLHYMFIIVFSELPFDQTSSYCLVLTWSEANIVLFRYNICTSAKNWSFHVWLQQHSFVYIQIGYDCCSSYVTIYRYRLVSSNVLFLTITMNILVVARHIDGHGDDKVRWSLNDHLAWHTAIYLSSFKFTAYISQETETEREREREAIESRTNGQQKICTDETCQTYRCQRMILIRFAR
jgi:hypothetical protein